MQSHAVGVETVQRGYRQQVFAGVEVHRRCLAQVVHLVDRHRLAHRPRVGGLLVAQLILNVPLAINQVKTVVIVAGEDCSPVRRYAHSEPILHTVVLEHIAQLTLQPLLNHHYAS